MAQASGALMSRGMTHRFKIRHPSNVRDSEGRVQREVGTDTLVQRGRISTATEQDNANGVGITNVALVEDRIDIEHQDLVVVDLGIRGFDGTWRIVSINRTRAHTRLGLQRYEA